MTIERYMLVDRNNQARDYIYDSFQEAKDDAAQQDCAVVALVYELDDEDLAWTPDGSSTWPPKAEETSA